MISNMNFIITPAYAIEHDIDDQCVYVIVSSSHRYDALAERDNVIVLHFADDEEGKRTDSVNEHDVKTIVDFLNRSEASDAFISCDEGKSRSPAIAAGLLKCSGREDSYIWRSSDYRPNALVYKSFLQYFIQHSYPSHAVAKELKNIASRSNEEYRYFRRKGKDLEYDKIVYREVGGFQICYGFIYGEKKHVVLFVKVGRDGSVFGYQNKYLDMANHIAEKYGITVIVSSNPFCSYKWKEPLDDAAEMLYQYFETQQIDKTRRRILYYGHSDGASMIAIHGKKYEVFDAFLLSNLPLPKLINDDDDSCNESIKEEAIKIMLNLTVINDNKPLILVYGEKDTGYKTYERIMDRLLVNYGQTFEVHVLKNEEHRISEPVVKILPELFFDENVLIDKGLEQDYSSH